MFSEEKRIVYQDSPNIDAFGRLRTSGTGQRLDVEFIYDKQDDVFDEIIVGAGTVTHQASSRDLILEANSVTNGDEATMQSYPIPYTPGNSQLVAITGVLNEANIAGGSVEVFFRSKVTGSVVETTYDQSVWNVDTLSSVDWTNSQILEIDFQSLKVGRIRFALNMAGVIVPFHTIENDNIRNTGYWQLPSLPLLWSVYNDATHTYCEMGYGDKNNGIGIRFKVAVNAAVQLRAICGTVKSEGGLNILDIEGFHRAADMGVTPVTVGTTLIPLISVRPKALFKTFDNLALGIPLEVSVDTDNPIKLVVIHDGVLTAASWVDVDSNESMMEYDISATAISNGHIVASDYIAAQRNKSTPGKSLLGKTLLWNKQGTRTGIFTVCAVRTTGTSASVLASIKFKEIR